MKGKVSKEKLDTEKYVNKETGEMMSSEIPGNVTISKTDPDLIILDSEEYVIIDSQALSYIKENFSPTDMGRIMKMADMTQGEFNVLYNGQSPHTTASLMENLDYTRNKFANFMNRLERKSVIYYIVGYTNGKKVKHIMLNPYLARKRKTIHKDCIKSFQNIRTLD